MGFGILRVGIQRLFDEIDGCFTAALLQGDDSAQVQRNRMARFSRQNMPVDCLGLLEPARAVVFDGQIQKLLS